MATSPSVSAQMMRYAVSRLDQMLGERAGKKGSLARASSVEMARAIQHAFRGTPGLLFRDAQKIARRAQAVIDSAAQMNANPDARLRAAQHGQDASILDGAPRYRYRILVTVQTGAGTSVTVATEIDSDNALSKRELEQRARESVTWDDYASSSKRETIVSGVASAAPVVTVLSAGQR